MRYIRTFIVGGPLKRYHSFRLREGVCRIRSLMISRGFRFVGGFWGCRV